MRVNLRKLAVDSVACAIFWTLVYIPIFLYTSRSLNLSFVGLGSAATVEISFGGLYGKFLDLFRRKLGLVSKDISYSCPSINDAYDANL